MYSEVDVRKRHDELCDLFIQMQTPVELSEEHSQLEEALNKEEEKIKELTLPHRRRWRRESAPSRQHYRINNNNNNNITNKKLPRIYSSHLSQSHARQSNKITTTTTSSSTSNTKSKGNSYNNKNYNKEEEEHYSNSQLDKHQEWERHAKRHSVHGQGKSSSHDNHNKKSQMDSKTFMLLAKNYHFKSLPPVFTEANATFKATQNSLHNVRDTLIHLTYDYSNSNEIALPLLTVQAIEESHKQFLHQLHPLSANNNEKEERNKKEQQKKKKEEQEQLELIEKQRKKSTERSLVNDSSNNRYSLENLYQTEQYSLNKEEQEEEEEEEEEVNNSYNDDNVEENINAILELAQVNTTEWNMYVKRARVAAADEFGQTFNPYQNNTLWRAAHTKQTSSNIIVSNINNNNNNNSNNNNKKGNLTFSPNTTLTTNNKTEGSTMQHSINNDPSFSSTTINNKNNSNINESDAVHAILNDAMFNDECASLSDYAAEPILNEYSENEMDFIAASSSSSSSSESESSMSSSSSSSMKRKNEKSKWHSSTTNSIFAESIASLTQTSKKKCSASLHHHHNNNNNKNKKGRSIKTTSNKEQNDATIETKRAAKKQPRQKEESHTFHEHKTSVSVLQRKECKDTIKATTGSKTLLSEEPQQQQQQQEQQEQFKAQESHSAHLSSPYNAPHFLTNNLQLMREAFAKVQRGMACMSNINNYFTEWFNSATQIRRMKLNAIRCNYHARRAHKLNERIRQHLLLHAYYLNHYSAHVRHELVQQQNQLRLFDDRFVQSEVRTSNIINELGELQVELQEENTRRMRLLEEMKELVITRNDVSFSEHYEEEQQQQEEEQEGNKSSEHRKEEKKKEMKANTTLTKDNNDNNEEGAAASLIAIKTLNTNSSNSNNVLLQDKKDENNNNYHSDEDDSLRNTDDPLRVELLLLLQNFPFPRELNRDVVEVQRWLLNNPQCCLS